MFSLIKTLRTNKSHRFYDCYPWPIEKQSIKMKFLNSTTLTKLTRPFFLSKTSQTLKKQPHPSRIADKPCFAIRNKSCVSFFLSECESNYSTARGPSIGIWCSTSSRSCSARCRCTSTQHGVSLMDCRG